MAQPELGGHGAVPLNGWVRNSQIQLVANPNYWGGKPAFQRIVIRHFEDGAAQLLALRRGDIDVAFNLLPEQITSMKGDKEVWIAEAVSLDFVYMALTQNAELNKALANKFARQAIAYAIDYDGIIDSLSAARRRGRRTSFRSARWLDRGAHQGDRLPAGSRALEEGAGAGGLPDGFEFDVIYGNSMVAGTSYHVIAQKCSPTWRASASR